MVKYLVYVGIAGGIEDSVDRLKRKISKFIEELVGPRVVHPNLESAYAEMARDKAREKEAMEWAEVTFCEAKR